VSTRASGRSGRLDATTVATSAAPIAAAPETQPARHNVRRAIAIIAMSAIILGAAALAFALLAGSHTLMNLLKSSG
jgi:hypothetical protein